MPGMSAYPLMMSVIFFFFAGALAYTGIRARRRSLRRNPWVGIRTRPLMRSDRAWERGHAAAAPHLIAAAVLAAVSGAAFLVVDEAVIAWWSLAAVVIVLALLWAGTSRAHRVVAAGP